MDSATGIEVVMNAAEITNAVVEQKNVLLHGINGAEDADALEAVIDQLTLVAPLWKAVGYTYKVTEVLALMKIKAGQLKRHEVDYLQKLRKNDKTRESTVTNIAKLNAIIEG